MSERTANAPNPTTLRAALVCSVLALSAAAILIRKLRVTGAEPLAIAGWRMLASAALLAPGLTREVVPALRRHAAAYLAAGASLGLHFCTWTLSLDHIPVARSVLLVDLQPIFVTFAAWAWLGERPRRSFSAALLLAFAGVGVMSWSGLGEHAAGDSRTGDALALAGAAAIAVYVLASRRLRATVGLANCVIPIYVVAGVASLVASSASGEVVTVPRDALWPLVGLAAIPTLGGHTVLNWALRHVPARVVSLTFLGEPAGAALLAVIFLGEVPDAATIVGGLLCLSGVVLVVLRR